MDIETLYSENEKIKPYCVCIRINNESFSFWHSESMIKDFLEFIVKKSLDNYIEIYTHNINFDGLIMIDNIKDLNINFNFFARNNNLYWIKIEYLKTVIMIRCSYKIMPVSVKNLGLIKGDSKQIFPYKFSLEKNLNYVGPIPPYFFFENYEDYLTFSKENSFFDFKKVSIKYCFKDIEIVHDMLINLIKIISSYDKNCINNSYSFSSISYKIFIKKFDIFKIDSFKNNNYVHNYIKNSYYGGRCEVFGNPLEKEIIHHFDYSGMYSQCMMESFPFGEPILTKKNLDVNKIGFHTIRVKVNDDLPFLPYRGKKLYFPCGEFVGVYWYEEILNSLKNNKCVILDHYSSLLYEREDFLFKQYVNYFIELRKKKGYYNIFGKNMVNGLYGSFALNEDDDYTVITLSEDEYKSYEALCDIINFRKIGSYFIIKIKKNEKSQKLLDKNLKWKFNEKKRNIAYASIIASKARIKLNNSLEKVVKNGGSLYYTDTDSIFAGFKNNRLNETLGDITWNEVFEDGVFISSKFYHIKDKKMKVKGISYNSYNFDLIKNKFYKDEKNLEFKNQNFFDRKSFVLFQKDTDKSLSLNSYDKRVFSADKKKTKPIYINPDY